MVKKILPPIIMLILGYGFWVSPDFKELAFGVAIFLFGMLALEDGFRSFTGGMMERLLKGAAGSRAKCLGLGFATTALVQSSGLVSVVLVSFLSAGLLTLAQATGIILGANVGTSTGGWIIAVLGLNVDIAALSMPLLVFGVLLIFQTRRNTRGLGYLLAGLGFLFLGMHHIKAGFEFFRDKVDLIHHATTGVWGLVSFAALGTLATVLLQSSHATLAILLTGAMAGQITYENGAAILIGANVGTTSTGVFAALGGNEEGRRLALAHFVFNTATALVVTLGFTQALWLVDGLYSLAGLPRGEVALKLALFHTAFNLFSVALVYPLLSRFEALVERIIPRSGTRRAYFSHLNTAAVDFPDTAVEAVRRELAAMYEDVVSILVRVLGFTPEEFAGEAEFSALAARREEVEPYPVDEIYRERVKERFSGIIEFISRAPFSWHESQSQRIFWLRNAGRSLVEAVKAAKHLQKNLVRYSVSANEAQREAYLNLRAGTAETLAELERMRKGGEREVLVVALDNLRLTVAEEDNALMERIYAMIGEGRITPEMGTSLINDHWYVSEMVNHLADAAGTLFGDAGTLLHGAQRSVALDRGELKNLARRGEAQPKAAREENGG